MVAQMVKNLPSMQETWVGFLGQEDPLEKEMATHSYILTYKHGHFALVGLEEQGGREQAKQEPAVRLRY